MIYQFHNKAHLGDCLLQCHYLCKVAPLKPGDWFIFRCERENVEQCQEVVEHLPNVAIEAIKEKRSFPFKHDLESIPESFNCWINDEGLFGKSKLSSDYIAYYLSWFDRMSELTGLPKVFAKRSDMLFDYPALLKRTILSDYYFDYLMVNSSPMSGQWNYKEEDMERFIGMLAKRGSVIVTQPTQVENIPCTADYFLSSTGIGNLSLKCKNHICNNTGPSWPTYNVHNIESIKFRAVLHNFTSLNFEAFRCETFRDINSLAARIL